MTTLRETPSHCPLLYHAARHLRVNRVTIKRAISGKISNPDLVTSYREYVVAYLDKLTVRPPEDATLASHAANQKRKPRPVK